MNSKFITLFLIGLITLGCQSNKVNSNKLADLDPDLPNVLPKIFALGKVTTPMQDWGITMSGDGTEIYYTATVIKAPGNSKSAIVGLKWENGKWNDPEVVPFSGSFKDQCPNISTNGKKMIFVSRRPTSSVDTIFDGNIWAVERSGESWGDAYPINEINTDGGEFFPTLAPSGDIYYCTNYLGRGNPVRIYHSKYINGKYQKPQAITGEILTSKGEYCPYILPDEKHLIIEIVDGHNGLGGGDMYISKKNKDDSWSKAVHLGTSVNSDQHDCYPILSNDGEFFIFMSMRKPAFIKDDGVSTFNELLWDVTIPYDQKFDFYWINTEFLKKHL